MFICVLFQLELVLARFLFMYGVTECLNNAVTVFFVFCVKAGLLLFLDCIYFKQTSVATEGNFFSWLSNKASVNWPNLDHCSIISAADREHQNGDSQI